MKVSGQHFSPVAPTLSSPTTCQSMSKSPTTEELTQSQQVTTVQSFVHDGFTVSRNFVTLFCLNMRVNTMLK